jgi:MoxR-like ATPase
VNDTPETPETPETPAGIDEVAELLASHDYVAERPLATAIFLALRMHRPLFLEGEPGVGKTEVARVLAQALALPLLRLQCYEGLDLAQAAYEWNYPKQLLRIRTLEATSQAAAAENLFSREYLVARPLLRAIDPHETGGRSVLLIDELDRADEELEAFLLELLGEYQITIPELGTIRAERPPVVILTSNRTREIHDALKRRCLYHWIPFPDFEKELQIVRRRAPGAPEHLARQVVGFVQALREEELFKRPGVAETLDWIQALVALDRETLTDEVLRDTLGVLLKVQDDIDRIDSQAARRLLERSRLAAEAVAARA